jgi:hypothetical protein
MEMMDLNEPWESSRKIPENCINSGDSVSGSSMSVGALVVELHTEELKFYCFGLKNQTFKRIFFC